MKFPAHLCFGIVSLELASLPTTARDDPSVKMIGVGLYGSNGHPLTSANFLSRSLARLAAAGRNTSLPESATDRETTSGSPSKTS